MSHNSPAGKDQELSGRVWRFADYEFDEMGRELRVNGHAVEVESKPLDVLLQLLLHAGEVVTKEELLESVWPDVMVVDASLATAVSKLRKAMGDEDHPAVITVPRVGYRLAVPVRCQVVAAPAGAELGLNAGDAVPGREHWRLKRPMDPSGSSQVWLAENPKTHEPRIFKFASDGVQLKGLKREVTLSRFLRESLGDRPEFVRVLEWNFNAPPFFLESEYCGPNLAEWAESQGGLNKVPLGVRLKLLADVAKAVAAAHDIGLLHKDLKPANILIVPRANGGWQIKVADFGSASMFEPSRLHALGITNLGFTQTATPETTLTGTLMYLAPEVLAGQSPTGPADVFALGVMLYQLVIGDFRKPLAPGWEVEIADQLIREDISDAACGDPARRLGSAAELAGRLSSLERRRFEQDQLEQTEKSKQIAERKRAEARARRPWVMLAAVAFVALGVSLYFYRISSPLHPPVRTVAVLPFQNAGSDQSVDFLRLALPDEVATTLSYMHSLSIRPSATISKYTGPNLDVQKAGQEMGVSSIVTGHFFKEGEQLHITLEAIDVRDKHLLWRDTLNVPAQNLISMQKQIATRVQVGLASALGATALTTDQPTRPTNEEAYDLYLRSAAVPFDPGPNQQARTMLERAVGLDPNYAPAWAALARRYYVEGRYASHDEAMMERFEAATERALALDPNYIAAAGGLATRRLEQGELTKAYQAAEDLVQRRPDSADAHFILSYVLRFAGLLQESADHCETAFSLDPHTQTNLLRSCAIVFLLRGNYARAMDYVHIDGGSDFAKALSVHILIREGKEKEAAQLGSPNIPQWGSYDMLLACAERKPSAEIAALVRMVQPADDPEANYLSAAHLAYCGQTSTALQMLKRAVQGNYCSYPAMDSDPFFASLRANPEFSEIRSAAIACQNKFLAERDR
jgi:serine/threonine protein kinase/DNA-binding winged helix-turn-helix (wHTH) protein/Tfp pilus assembly protein PilF